MKLRERSLPVKGDSLLKSSFVPWTSQVDFFASEKSVGNGEMRLMDELKIKGYNVLKKSSTDLYDLSINDLSDMKGNWEVKEVGGDLLDFRVGVCGRRVTRDFLERMLANVDIILKTMKPQENIRTILEKARDNILSGEFSKGQFLGGTTKYPLGLNTIFGICNLMTPKDHDFWTKYILPSQIFTSHSGVIFVNEKDGYAPVFTDELDDKLVFQRISQGSLRFEAL